MRSTTPTRLARELTAAAQAGQVGEVIRLARVAAGLSQKALGELCECGQPTVSRIESNQQSVDAATLRLFAEKLDLPAALVGLAERPRARTAPPEEDPVKRREFLAAAAALAIPSGEPDHALAAIHTITTAHRRLDADTPSRDLSGPVSAHLRMVTRRHAQAQDPHSQRRLAAAISEIAGFAGWLAWDMHDLGSARAHYVTAINAARGAKDGTVHAYMLGSLATLAVYEGDSAEGMALLRRAAAEVRPDPPATAIAWLSCLEAVAQADAGNARAAFLALDRADDAVGLAGAQETPPWPWVFQFDHIKVARHRLTCAARLRLPAAAQAAAAQTGGFLTTGSPKQRALALLDVATAHLHENEPEEAFAQAAAAVDLGITTRSGRVVAAARQFRRLYTGSPAAVRSFDQRLYSANL